MYFILLSFPFLYQTEGLMWKHAHWVAKNHGARILPVQGPAPMPPSPQGKSMIYMQIKVNSLSIFFVLGL